MLSLAQQEGQPTTILQIASLLIVLAGAFGAINYLYLRLPPAIGILVVALLASMSLLAFVGVEVFALALSLPESEWKPLILTATYIVVVFSIIVQGLTVARLAEKVGREPGIFTLTPPP